jgi:hypothetical protein
MYSNLDLRCWATVVSIEQAEACRPKPDAFYLEKERKGEKPLGRGKGEEKEGKFDSSRRRSSPFQRDRRRRHSGQRPESKPTSDTRCYNCSGYGHFARVCPTRVEQSQGRDKRTEQKRLVHNLLPDPTTCSIETTVAQHRKSKFEYILDPTASYVMGKWSSYLIRKQRCVWQ